MTTMTPWPSGVAQVFLILGALACWVFIGRYTWLYKWWKTDVGRDMISVSGCLGAFYTYAAVVVTWPDLPGKTAIRVVLFAAITACMFWRLWMFERVRREIKALAEVKAAALKAAKDEES